MQIRSVGIDLGKTTFHLVALSAAGKVLLRKKFTQKQLVIFTANMQTSLIGMEACSGAHFLGRVLREQGHDVKRVRVLQDLRQIPGIGPLVATAIVAAIGNGAAFRKGRDFASWLGLVPRQHSTGGKARLFGISKRGNCYLRKLLVHGARSAVLRVKRERSPFGPWLDALERRASVKVVITAAANKLARVAWAVLSSGEEYRPPIALMHC